MWTESRLRPAARQRAAVRIRERRGEQYLAAGAGGGRAGSQGAYGGNTRAGSRVRRRSICCRGAFSRKHSTHFPAAISRRAWPTRPHGAARRTCSSRRRLRCESRRCCAARSLSSRRCNAIIARRCANFTRVSRHFSDSARPGDRIARSSIAAATGSSCVPGTRSRFDRAASQSQVQARRSRGSTASSAALATPASLQPVEFLAAAAQRRAELRGRIPTSLRA